MSGSGAWEPGELRADGLRVAVVASSWHSRITNALLESARRAAEATGVECEITRVPGAFEVPVVAAALAETNDAVVALAVVIRGGTPHFDYVCRAVTDGLVRVSLDSGKPVGFGVLTCDDELQALDRAGLPGSTEDKGAEAALSAIETALILRGIRSGAGDR